MSRRTVVEWTAHWDGRAEIEDEVEVNGYCVDGCPIDRGLYRSAVVEPCLALLELAPQHHVLDVGCGVGLLLRELESRVDRAVGTDLSEAMLGRYKGTSETLVCAADDLPFEGEQFDRILMYSVAHYFPDVDYFRRVVLRLVDLLRTPGILLVGDVPLGQQPRQTAFRSYDRREVLEVLEPLKLPFSIAAQSRVKRAINRRYDIVVYKD